MAKHVLCLCALILLGAGPALADIEQDDDTCNYNNVDYPPGSELCQNGNLVKCEDGDWNDMGDCPQQAPQQPNDDGGGLER